MLERHDIDALLIGRLYGELSVADEARLSQHLETHPADRAVLDNLSLAREVVRGNGIWFRPFEPPQYVSARILQEAARRAPKLITTPDEQHEGWFARFVRAFARHPAMAAAAMLVLVVGVAGTMYIKDKPQFAEQTVASDKSSTTTPELSTTVTNETPPAAQPAFDRGGAVAGSGSAIAQGQVENNRFGYNAALDDELGATNGVKADGKAGEGESGKAQLASATRVPAEAPKMANQKNGPSGITVLRKQPMPKDFETSGGDSFKDEKKAKQDHAEDQQASADIALEESAGRGKGNGNATHTVAPASPDPSPATKPSDSPRQEKVADKTKETSDASLLAWAGQQHARLTQLVQAGDCAGAAKVAVAILNRAPDYYSSKIANDRAVKQCMAYINDAREKDAEQAAKARAKRVNNVDEPANLSH